ncbi:SusC/RagA family TonB-linked outer membrane protein [Bacteroidia bacterium]|nr:SusC/RagA family TonB-linked outer membrane protein [Bacteroidia bacterium]
MKNKFLITLTTLLLSAGAVLAQDLNVSGTVHDASGDPVVGATVMVKGTSTGVVTGISGDYNIQAPSDGTLTFSFLGLGTVDVAVNGKARLDVRMANGDQELQEVVVVGYGTQKKKDVTSSIARVSGEDIANMSAPSFESQLAGRAAGVQVTTSSGMVGTAPEFQIRGFSTISSGSQPLFVIDGVPANSGQKQQLYGRYNPMADINPNDIASIEILKDGAATAIYGSRAANGVVLVTTKKGNKGKTQVTYDGYVGWASPTKLHDLLGAEDFVTITNEKYENWGMTSPAVLDPNGVNTNWNDYIYQTGFQQSHNLSISGGTDKSQYYTSFGYSDMEGIIRASNQERYNITANITQNATKWLTVGTNVQVARTTLNGVMNEENSLGSIGFAGIRMLPNVEVFNSDDKTGYNIDAANRKTLGRGANKTYIDNGIQNIVWAMDNNINRSKSTRIIGGGFAEIKFFEGLTLRTQGGVDLTLLNDFMKWDPESGDGYGYGGILEDVNTTYYNWNWQNVLNFNRTFADVHNVSATVVQEYTHTDYEWTDASVTKLSDPFFTEHIISNTFGTPEIGGSKSSNGLASYLFRANYNYDSRYYIGGSVRRDGLSRLPKDTRWGTFYGGSAAWRVSRESFWTSSPLNSWFNDLRLRASVATIGNSNLGSDFPYIGTYGAKLYGNQSGIAWNNMGNDQLKWESTTTYDVGLDGSLFNGRLSFELAYFQKNTNDLVMEVPTPPSLGIPYNSYYDNIGAITNSGVEIQVSGTPVAVSGFKWQADFNISFVSNKVKTLVNGADLMQDNYTITREGESYKSIYGYDYYGVNKANGNPIWRKADGSLVQFSTFGDASLGEQEYDYAVYDPANPSDVSQPSSLSASDDRKILGSSLPTWYGGFNNTFTYKGFDLNVFLRFSGGNKIMNATRQELLNLNFSNNGKEILGRWQSTENPGDGMMPKIGYGDENVLLNNGYTDSHFVEDGSYLRLANLALGYTLPASIISKVGISKARIYVQAQNLLTITGYDGLDPETSTRTGVDWTGMPQQKVFTFGVNVTF